jgi:hypothetical protein
MVFGSALNLLLFSPTYGTEILERMKKTIRDDKRRTYLFSVSTTAKADMIAELETNADNLILSRSTRDPFRLFMRIERMKGTKFVADEVEIPFIMETLEEVKEIAEHTRQRVIPLVSKI